MIISSLVMARKCTYGRKTSGIPQTPDIPGFIPSCLGPSSLSSLASVLSGWVVGRARSVEHHGYGAEERPTTTTDFPSLAHKTKKKKKETGKTTAVAKSLHLLLFRPPPLFPPSCQKRCRGFSREKPDSRDEMGHAGILKLY